MKGGGDVHHHPTNMCAMGCPYVHACVSAVLS